MGLHQVAQKERGVPHFEAQCLGLVRAGDHQAVVVGEHNDWPLVQPGIEGTLTGDIKVIAVHQADDVLHWNLSKDGWYR